MSYLLRRQDIGNILTTTLMNRYTADTIEKDGFAMNAGVPLKRVPAEIRSVIKSSSPFSPQAGRAKRVNDGSRGGGKDQGVCQAKGCNGPTTRIKNPTRGDTHFPLCEGCHRRDCDPSKDR